MDMKTISAPYVPQLDELQNPDEISTMLETMGTRSQINVLNWPDKFAYAPLATFTIAHSGTAIYIDFFVRCNYLRAENTANQSPVSDDSCVEFFVSPTCDSLYWNFEFNCIGAVNSSHRRERKNKTPLTDEEISRIRRYTSCGTRPFKEMEGMFAWNVIVAIPLDLMDVHYEGNPIEMRANFYKIAAATSAPHYLSWNPIKSEEPDFHRVVDFGRLILE
jgi:hypothetical protein